MVLLTSECPEHPFSRPVEACVHISDAVKNKSCIEHIEKIDFIAENTYFFCRDCLGNHKNKIKEFEKFTRAFKKRFNIGYWEDFDCMRFDEKRKKYFYLYNKHEVIINKSIKANTIFSLCCFDCLDEIIIEQDKKGKLSCGFPVFRRTLTENNKLEIKLFWENLKNNYKFSKNIFPEEVSYHHNIIGQPFYVTPGNFAHPFTITLLDIIEEREQDKLIETVGSLLEESGFNQVRLKFYDARGCYKTHGPKGREGYVRVKREKFLREIFLNCFN